MGMLLAFSPSPPGFQNGGPPTLIRQISNSIFLFLSTGPSNGGFDSPQPQTL